MDRAIQKCPLGRGMISDSNQCIVATGSFFVSVLDSGAEGPGFKSQSRLRQTVHIHRAFVHQAAKLVAALLRVAGVTAGLAESNGNLPPGL